MFTISSRQFLFVSIASFIDFTLDEKMQYKTKQNFVRKFQMLDCNLKFQSLKSKKMVIKKNLCVKS